MLKAILIIWIGSGIGGVFRYLVQDLIARNFHITFPLGTFMINIAGCFLIGIFFGLTEKFSWMTAEWRWFLITGICGGFTTFSSFSYDNISLLRQGGLPLLCHLSDLKCWTWTTCHLFGNTNN